MRNDELAENEEFRIFEELEGPRLLTWYYTNKDGLTLRATITMNRLGRIEKVAPVEDLQYRAWKLKNDNATGN